MDTRRRSRIAHNRSNVSGTVWVRVTANVLRSSKLMRHLLSKDVICGDLCIIECDISVISSRFIGVLEWMCLYY